MRTAPFDFSQKLFPFNIHRTPPLFLQPIRMADATPTAVTPAPHSIQSKPNDDKNHNPAKEVPPPPEKPDPGDCCGSGCVRCVWDIYYDELEEYNRLYKQDDSNPKPS